MAAEVRVKVWRLIIVIQLFLGPEARWCRTHPSNVGEQLNPKR